jgi:SAM-dependent methyltransferase
MKFENDPLGAAIWDFQNGANHQNITVESDLCDDDVIPVEYLFRTLDEMPDLELTALKEAKGKVLDVGAGAGCHSKVLQEKGLDVTALDTSKGACDYLESIHIATVHERIENHKGQQYDTILILMNGLGLAGNRDNLPSFLQHLKSLLKPGGQIIADSADITYLFEDEEGGLWVDLNAQYYGEMKFNMKYKDQESGWFDWVYVDQKEAEKAGDAAGFKSEIMAEGPNMNYLIKFTL